MKRRRANVLVVIGSMILTWFTTVFLFVAKLPNSSDPVLLVFALIPTIAVALIVAGLLGRASD